MMMMMMNDYFAAIYEVTLSRNKLLHGHFTVDIFFHDILKLDKKAQGVIYSETKFRCAG